jgi:hypothetical protein
LIPGGRADCTPRSVALRGDPDIVHKLRASHDAQTLYAVLAMQSAAA